MAEKYTIEDFQNWLNADKSRKAGLQGWWWVIRQTKSDKDLQASLIHGNDQGGWNFSDPEWRKSYKWWGENFDDYYQVFLKYKAEVDAEEEKEQTPTEFSLAEFKKWLEENKKITEVKEATKKIKEIGWDKLFPTKSEEQKTKSQQKFNTLLEKKTFENMPENFKPIHTAIHLWKEEKDNSIKFTSTKLNEGQIKYFFKKPDNSKLTYAEFINFLKAEDQAFLKTLSEALNNATDQTSAYFWECVPVSQKTINKPFEFVVTKSEELNNISQDYSPFQKKLNKSKNKFICSFLNLENDAFLVVPALQKNKDYKNVSQFTKNAPMEQQKELWKEVAEKLEESLSEGKPKWLSTHGLVVYYLHVRINDLPKHYHYKEYEEEKSQQIPTQTTTWWERNKTWIKWGGGIIAFLVVIVLAVKWIRKLFSK